MAGFNFEISVKQTQATTTFIANSTNHTEVKKTIMEIFWFILPPSVIHIIISDMTEVLSCLHITYIHI